MTADIELLPLPEGVDVIFSPDGNGAALDVFTAEQMQDYARANVAHATAAKDAEIEALVHDLEQTRANVMAEHEARIEAEVRAERLAEALQKLAAHVRPTCSVLWEEARAALRDHDQEVGNG